MSTPDLHDLPDIEDLAFREGIKPGLRLSLSAAETADAVRRYRAAGAHCRRGEHRVRYDGDELFILYVAWRQEDADAMSAAEAPTLRLHWTPMGPEAHAQCHRTLGSLLGFPDCCVRHFIETSQRWDHVGRAGLGGRLKRFLRRPPIVARPEGAHRGHRLDERTLTRIARDAQDYMMARENLTSHPDARLNHFLFASRARLISFYPCSYSCASGIAIAERILEALERGRAGARLRMLAALSRPVLAGACGGRATVEIAADGHIVSATPPCAPGRTAFERDVDIARRAVGKLVDPSGFVRGIAAPGMEDALVLDFGRAFRDP